MTVTKKRKIRKGKTPLTAPKLLLPRWLPRKKDSTARRLSVRCAVCGGYDERGGAFRGDKNTTNKITSKVHALPMTYVMWYGTGGKRNSDGQ